jgi:hypothetical protein
MEIDPVDLQPTHNSKVTVFMTAVALGLCPLCHTDMGTGVQTSDAIIARYIKYLKKQSHWGGVQHAAGVNDPRRSTRRAPP